MQKYMILRDMSGKRTDGDDGPLRDFSVNAGSDGPPEPRIEVESFERVEERDLLRDPEICAYAPVMETKLIDPTSEVQSGRADSWGISAVGADRSSYSGKGVIVAVLDTGIDRDHASFAGVNITERDFSGSGNGDRKGHGTHCAGTIFGKDVGGQRIGVARGIRSALIGKVLDDVGRGNSEMLFNALTWAAENHADVISMSLGFDFPGRVRTLVETSGWPIELATSDSLEAYRKNIRMFDTLLQMIRQRQEFTGGGGIVVAASGNESRRNDSPQFVIPTSIPAAADHVISVGALQRVGESFDIASFSNIFPKICGPGVGIVSAKAGGGLVEMTGTSMACPHVAGVGALWWEFVRNRGLPANFDTVKAKMESTARDDVFLDSVNVADRGLGLVSSP